MRPAKLKAEISVDPPGPLPNSDRALLEEINRKLDLLLAQPGRRSAFSEADRALVVAIYKLAAARSFSAWEVIDAAQLEGAGTLRDAIVAAVGAENTLRLGKLLRRLEGQDIAGLRVERIGADRQGALWRVAEVR